MFGQLRKTQLTQTDLFSEFYPQQCKTDCVKQHTKARLVER